MATAAGDPSRFTVRTGESVAGFTSTSAPSPLHTQGCPPGAMARHSDGVPIEMELPTWRVAMSTGVMPSPALTQAIGDPGAAAIPVGFAPIGTVRPATSDGNAIVVTELVSNSATRAVVP